MLIDAVCFRMGGETAPEGVPVFWGAEALQRLAQGRRPLAFNQLPVVDSHQAHLKMVSHLTQTTRQAIGIAGNGICSSGRIVNHMKAMLGDNRHNVLLSDARLSAFLGAFKSTRQGGNAELDRKRHDLRAGISGFSDYPPYADPKGLVNLVPRMCDWPSEVQVVHGEASAKQQQGAAPQWLYALKGLRISLPGLEQRNFTAKNTALCAYKPTPPFGDEAAGLTRKSLES